VYKYGIAQICVLLLLVKKKVAVVSSTKSFPMAELALQLEVPTASATASIPSPTDGEECWNSGLEVASIQLEVVVATSKAAGL
jgi:hypothetical protein